MIRYNNQINGIIAKWWQDLQETPGPRAKLRRADGVASASMERPAIELCRKIGGQDDLDQVALIAALLSHVKENRPGVAIAVSLGSPQTNPVCSVLRFRRILEAKTLDEQFTAFRRAVVLLKGAANINDMIESIFEFNDPERREGRRRRWLFDYYQPETWNFDETNAQTSTEASR